MSTRCSIHFTWGAEVQANVYRHSDGYPDGDDGVLASLERFFAAVEQQARADTRFEDPSYLAAKFVVWQAGMKATRLNPHTFKPEPAPPLAFTGVGVQIEDPGDIAYRYRVDCRIDANGARPAVTWQKASEPVQLASAWHSGPEGSGA